MEMTHRLQGIVSACGFCLLWWTSSGVAADANGFALDIKKTSLAQLMSLKITSLSMKSESLRRAPAAVYVITRDDIRRMGVTHIAEALRYVPGVEVNRVEAGKWSVGVRGFGSTTSNANKMLVLIDGRSIYSTLFSGVLWEEKDVMLEDVDRIEVIRGPGSTIWGANAVNGVINIITRSAKDTQGGIVTGGVGQEEKDLAQGRYGWQMGDSGYARVYAKSVERDNSGSTGAVDNSDHRQTGFRADMKLSTSDNLTVQGDYYEGENGTGFQGFLVGNGEEYHGGNLLLNWNHSDSPNQDQRVLAYYDNTQLDNAALKDSREIWNLEYVLHHRWERHDLVMGAGYRTISDEVIGGSLFYLDPSTRTDEVSSAFIQDEFKPFNDAFRLIVGTKYEVNGVLGT